MTDILIRGINIPQNCIDCLCYNTEFGYCQATEDDIESSFGNKPDNCPIQELPEHGDLIDRDAFREENEYYLNREFINPKYEDTLDDLLKDAPVVIPSNKEGTE